MTDNINIELNLLLDAVYQKYGYDFRDYSKAHVKRRILHRIKIAGYNNISELIPRILYDQKFFHVLLGDLSINVTEMFRDPHFYIAIKQHIIPILKTYPFIKIWHAGCSTGEEVYSMAILFKEEGIYDRTQIYATDFNSKVLKIAKEGIYKQELIEDYSKNYKKAGGSASFSDYFSSKYESAIISRSLKENIVFSDHNLVTDQVFGEMNMIVCRNTMIYFTKKLQNRVVDLFYNSLIPGGILCLGTKESLRFSSQQDNFDEITIKEKIYKKKY